MSHKWQPVEIEKLKLLASKGYEAEEISNVLINRNPEAIEAYCYKYRIPLGKKITCVNEQKFKELMKGK